MSNNYESVVQLRITNCQVTKQSSSEKGFFGTLTILKTFTRDGRTSQYNENWHFFTTIGELPSHQFISTTGNPKFEANAYVQEGQLKVSVKKTLFVTDFKIIETA